MTCEFFGMLGRLLSWFFYYEYTHIYASNCMCTTTANQLIFAIVTQSHLISNTRHESHSHSLFSTKSCWKSRLLGIHDRRWNNGRSWGCNNPVTILFFFLVWEQQHNWLIVAYSWKDVEGDICIGRFPDYLRQTGNKVAIIFNGEPLANFSFLYRELLHNWL